jgi:hypothetical protein
MLFKTDIYIFFVLCQNPVMQVQTNLTRVVRLDKKVISKRVIKKSIATESHYLMLSTRYESPDS